jgi:demethylmenaquinone methyltransferase/2-methoxy-6-polyprenyl-1,4-benzoquinol methylase
MTVETTAHEATGTGALRRPAEIQSMFDRIVRRYDLMNRLMTGGQDIAWRRKAAQVAIGTGAELVLDVATGTGDLAIELRRQGAPLVVGIDFAQGMLDSAAEKLEANGSSGIVLLRSDAMRLPFPDGSFDACTVAFGLRNMIDYQAAVSEMARVLRPGGRLVILEMTPVRNPLFRTVFGIYFDRIVPFVGGVISGDPEAYSYLPRSVSAFPNARRLGLMMQRAGLEQVRFKLLMMGTVALHAGVKAAAG